MSTDSGIRFSAPALRVAPLALSELTRAGIERCLAPFADQVILDLTGHYDVGLVDPDLLPDGWRERAGRPVVAVLRTNSDRAAGRARDLGALAVLEPPVEPSVLVASVRDTHQAWHERVLDELGVLSARETEVLTLICRGKTNLEIADDLFLSPNSIKTYIRTAYRKIGVNSRSRAVLWGVQHKL